MMIAKITRTTGPTTYNIVKGLLEESGNKKRLQMFVQIALSSFCFIWNYLIST